MFKTKIKITGLIFTFLVLSFGLIQTVSADTPPGFSFCTENNPSADGTQICRGGTMVTCDSTTVNTTSTDSKSMCNGTEWLYCSATKNNGTQSPDKSLTCDGTTWSATPSNPSSPDSCTTTGQVSSDKSKICQQDNTWLSCTSSNDGVVISGKQCSSLQWITPSSGGGGGGSYSTSCTTGNTQSNGSQICQSNNWVICRSSNEGTKISGKTCTSLKWVTNPQSPTAQITKVTVLPAGFNPTIDSTKISYTTSAKAVIDVKITDSFGQLVGTLVNSQTLDANSYSVIWYGTIGNEQGGTIIHSGTYHYKITAKNITTNVVEDSKEGDINLIFAAQDNSQQVDQGQTNTQTPAEQAAQAAATLALQNAKKGKTAKTGPDVLIYSMLPVAGYFISRRRK